MLGGRRGGQEGMRQNDDLMKKRDEGRTEGQKDRDMTPEMPISGEM